MNISEMHNMGPYVLAHAAQLHWPVTAAGTGDATEKNGYAVDRLASQRPLFLSAMLIISYTSTLDTTETISIAANGQTDSASAFNVAATDMVATRAYKVTSAGVKTDLTLTSGALASTVVGTDDSAGCVVIEFDLHDAGQYIRSQITFDLSRGGTDTATGSAVWVFGGAATVPAV